MASPRSLALRNVSKRFGGVVALDDASLVLRPREVHVVAGENGSGKTTLMNVLSGLYQPDRGGVWIDGRQVTLGSPRDALRLGIGMVHQHFEQVQPFSALENVLLGHEGGGWRLRLSQRRRAVETLMQRYGLVVALERPVQELSVGEQQKTEILKALYRGVDLLILDEPTTHLTPQEVGGLFATIRELVRDGLTVVLITHKLREIRDIGDSVSIMRRGQVVATLGRSEASEARLIELLMGERVVEANQREPRPTVSRASSVLEGQHLSAPGVYDCSFEVRSGEIVGVAGVAGNGQRELAEVIVGTRPLVSGALRLGGQDITDASVRERLLLGLGYIPEDRLREGILPRLSVAETFALGLHHALFEGRSTFDETRVRRLTREAIDEYGVVTPSERVPTARLSGGNIQKVLVARAMSQASRRVDSTLVAMNPTRGVDLGTTAFVHHRLMEMANRGSGVLLISEDLDELLRLSNRVLVMYSGRIAGQFARAEFDPYRIGGMMAGVEGPTATAQAI
ncbi:MAG: ABC transporter ATP-binding protein [Chloroflexota bacterium]